MNYGTEIKKIRKKLQLTQFELAEELGISKNFLSAIERDEKKLSEALSNKLSVIITKNRDNDSFWNRYKEGQNLIKVIERLRELGHSLAEIRTNLNTIDTEMSYMYVGIKPISEKIEKLLTTEYKINKDYLYLGSIVPMFENGMNSTLDVPYYKGHQIKDAVIAFNSNDLKDAIIYSFPSEDGPIQLFTDISGDNIQPTFNGKERLGIARREIEPSLYGRLFIIFLNNGTPIIRRVFPAKKNTVFLKKEDPTFPEIEYKLEEIESFYLVKMVISPDFI